MQVAFYLAGEITQVKESIPWVRCASGNVLLASLLSLHSSFYISNVLHRYICDTNAFTKKEVNNHMSERTHVARRATASFSPSPYFFGFVFSTFPSISFCKAMSQNVCQRILLKENPEKSSGYKGLEEGVTSCEIGDRSDEKMSEIFLSRLPILHDLSHHCKLATAKK